MSESSAVTVASYGKHNPPGSVGIPMLKTFIKIVQPETTHEVALGEKGEICIAGPIVMLGYAGNKKATAVALKIHPHDGKTWLHTGDFGHLDPDGILYLDGRLKRMIIRRGFKVFPVTIEKLLLTHPAVKECVVTGIADEQEVQVPRAHLVLQPNYDLHSHQVEQQLRSLCSEKLADYNCPKVYRFLSQIPLTSNSKADYRALEQLP
jgi:long-chain acyl-CoA synthetase